MIPLLCRSGMDPTGSQIELQHGPSSAGIQRRDRSGEMLNLAAYWPDCEAPHAV
jgi:hypothetical protein